MNLKTYFILHLFNLLDINNNNEVNLYFEQEEKYKPYAHCFLKLSSLLQEQCRQTL